jgi:hypothetical protein
MEGSRPCGILVGQPKGRTTSSCEASHGGDPDRPAWSFYMAQLVELIPILRHAIRAWGECRTKKVILIQDDFCNN